MKLCIFGGSFDPVHEGHVCVAEHARKYCGMDRVLFMPCSLSPLKEQAPSVTDDQRCRMIELAVDPEKARRYREESAPEAEDTCTMCGKMCPMKNMNRILKGEDIQLK